MMDQNAQESVEKDECDKNKHDFKTDIHFENFAYFNCAL